MTSRASVCLFALLGACSAGDDGSTAACSAGTACDPTGATCTTATDRCTCALGSGLAWECEPLACPVGATVDGASCSTAGLRCDTGFERPGTLCVGPELRWAACRYYHQAGELPPNGCPPTPPTVGAPCCQGLPPGGPPPGCLYGSDVYDCASDHWRPTTP